jgi:mRNA deadenylase 3'-5' endonuclease subunit Ccr4
VSLNILADCNVRTHYHDLYWHIPGYKWNYILDWEARKRKILWELGLWSPDVMCLQEVDHYDDLDEVLQQKGYVGVFTGRTGMSRDGCAMFWRTNRFELLEEESIKFIDHNLRDNVAQLCVLKCKPNANTPRSKNLEHNDSEDSGSAEPTTSGSVDSRDHCVVVGNIHVLFNPKRGDVKLGQTRLLMEKAHAISERWGKAPVAIAGDFNSTPNSPLYQFISSSQLDLAAHDRRYISGQEAEMSFSNERHSNGACKDERQATTSGPSETGADEESLPECIKTFELEESIVVATGEANSVAEISSSTTSTETLKRVSIPPRIRGWDQCELMAATGGKRLSVISHNMNLRSAYSEIEGKPGSRDERGEPWVTTCHKKFSGTVDYIWHTDDLIPVRVLDTIQTSDLPSEKWGSDHMALACEFSFVPSKEG